MFFTIEKIFFLMLKIFENDILMGNFYVHLYIIV
jgi:hypothetical protein